MHVLLPAEAGEDNEPPLAGAAMALGCVAGAAIDVEACAALAVLTLRICGMETEGMLIVGMLIEGVLKDKVGKAVVVAGFDVVVAGWDEGVATLDTTAELEEAVGAAEVAGTTNGALVEVVGTTVAAAVVAPGESVWPGTTIVPVAVGVPVVYT